MGAPLLQKTLGDRDIPCRVALLQELDCVSSAFIVDQHLLRPPISLDTRSHALENLRPPTLAARINQLYEH